MIYRHSSMLSGVILLLCSFSRMIVSFLPESMTYLVSGSCPLQQCYVCVPSHGLVFKSNVKMWLVTSITFVSLFYQCILQAGTYFRSQGSQLSDIDDYFSLLAVCLVPSSIMDTSQHVQEQLANTKWSLIFLCVCFCFVLAFFWYFFHFFQVLWRFFLREIT